MGKNLRVSVKRKIYREAGGICASCGVSCYENFEHLDALTQDMTDEGWTAEKSKVAQIDHIVPQRLGGTHDESNLQLLCWKCNGMKSGRTVEEFEFLKKCVVVTPEIAADLDKLTGRTAEKWLFDAGKIGTSAQKKAEWLLEMYGVFSGNTLTIEEYVVTTKEAI